MARLVYACRFDVQAANGIAEVLSTYRDWIMEYYRTRQRIQEFDFDLGNSSATIGLPNDHVLSSLIYREGEEQAVTIYWSTPDGNDKGLRWLNEVRIGQFGDRCGVEHLVSIESVEYNVAPAKLLSGSPRAVREICAKTTALIGEMQVRAEPYNLKQDGLTDLLTLLTSDLRKLPIVLLSPYASSEPNQIDPKILARNLAGVAVVVHTEHPELTWDFAEEVGRQLSCFNGAARIYWPGFTKSSDPRAHRLFLGDWIDQVGSDVATRTIERAIFAVAAFRYVPDKRIADLIRRVHVAERQRNLVEKRASGDEIWEVYERDLARLDDAEKTIEELRAENANLKANLQVVFASGTSTPNELGYVEEDSEVSFSNVTDATEVAAKRCKNLEVLDSAFAAAGDSPFQRPYDIFKALTDLNDIVDVWRSNREDGKSGGDLLQHLRDHGWGKRSSMHISDTTRAKHRHHYEFDYLGKKQLFEPHITIGAGDPNSCASIHFIFDQERSKIIVGHVGKHLPNTKT